MTGQRENYFIKDGYTIRPDAAFFDDTPFEDEFQRPVYEFARMLARKRDRIVDVGCGSGFKLMQFFSEFNTVGIDLPPTVEFLRSKYASRDWRLFTYPASLASLVICADVIEHVTDPDSLLAYVARWHAHEIVISTPERDLLKLGTEDGPPRNKHHVREWNQKEFAAYISEYFTIVQHFICDNATQVVHCVPLS
jgi:2-polyprenyl-3-methyl-5-hydroxy-6-metoxy-1,4-benzoquinol methylase